VPYVVLEPPSIRRIYDTWDEAKAAISGVRGVKQMYVETVDEGERILAGGVRLEPGLYAFTDGNHRGGVGVVIARAAADPSDPPEVERELSATVLEILRGARLPGLASPDEIHGALARLRNILSEVAAVYAAVGLVPEGETVTVVHDYRGVAKYWTGEWRTKDAEIANLTGAAMKVATRRGLTVRFREQRSHKSHLYGRHDYRRLNARADALATAATA